MSKVCLILNTIFRVLWGVIYDHLGFRAPYVSVCVTQIIVAGGFYFSGKNIYAFYVTNILENLVFSGHGSPLVTKIFGMKNSVTLFGVTGYYIGTAGFVGAVIAKFVIKQSQDYLIVYLIGCVLALVGFGICLTVKEDPFPYVPKKREDNKGNKDGLVDRDTTENFVGEE